MKILTTLMSHKLKLKPYQKTRFKLIKMVKPLEKKKKENVKYGETYIN